jgi:hypothetical protein
MLTLQDANESTLPFLPSLPNQHQNPTSGTATSPTSITSLSQDTGTPPISKSDTSVTLSAGEGTDHSDTTTSSTPVAQGTETASEPRKRKAVSTLPNTNEPPAIRTIPSIHVPESHVFRSDYTKEQVDANPDLPWYIFNVSGHGDIEENKRLVAALKFRPPGSTMTPAQAGQFPLLRRIVYLNMSWAVLFQTEGASQYMYK